MRTFFKATAISSAMIVLPNFALSQVATPVQLKAADAAANRYFGTSSAISGDTLAIGAPLASGGAISNNDGAVYVFRWNGTGWTQEQKIPGPSAISGPQTDFGRAVAISGETMVVGARLDDSAAADGGAAYIYTRNAGVWVFQQKITASNAAASDNFGDAVAIDGDTVVVAASGAEAGGTNRGSVYAFTRSGTIWSQQAILPAMSGAADGDLAGQNGALAISGDTVAVGAPSKGTNAGAVALYSRQISTWTNNAVVQSPDAGTDTAGRFGSSVSLVGDTLAAGAINSSKTVATGGGAYIYRRVSGAWGVSSTGVLVVPTGLAVGDSFGCAIALGADSLLVGSQGRATNTGAAYAFRFKDGVWTQESLILAPDAAIGDAFGSSVAMDGNIGVVGAQADDFGTSPLDAGSAWVVSRENGKWLSGPTYASLANAVGGDGFGFAAAIDGGYAVIGAYTDTVTAVGQGSAAIFIRGGTNWTFQQLIAATGGATNDNFGRSVGISGSRVIAGAPSTDNGGNVDQGAVYFFNRNGTTWAQNGGAIRASDGVATDYFGTSVGISGDYAVVGAYADDTGAFVNHGSAYVFERNANDAWLQIARLEASDKASNDLFGYASAISGDIIVVGAHNKAGVGSAYVFAKDGIGVFRQVAKLSPNDPSAGMLFGVSVATDGEIVVVGAQGKPAAYVYAKQNGTWSQVSKLTSPDNNPTDGFGVGVSVSNRQIAVATVTDRRGAVNGAGSAYLFTSTTGEATGPYVTQYRVNPVSGTNAAGDGVGYSVGISNGTIVGGSFTGTGITGRATEFADVTDSALSSVVNLTAQNTQNNLVNAMAAATDNQTIVAAAGAFSAASSINFNAKSVTVNSRTTIATPSTTLISLGDGSVLATASGYPMSLYGTVRTDNDSGRSDLIASSIRQGAFGSLNIGEHEVSLSGASTTFDGKTVLLSTKSALTSNGNVFFRGSISDLAGGRLSSSGSMTFDGVVNLKGTSIAAGGPLSVETNSNMTGVTVSSPANIVTGGGRWVLGGTVFGPLSNSGKIITAGAATFFGSITNNTGALLDLTGGPGTIFGTFSGPGLTGVFTGCPGCIGLPVGFRVESDLNLTDGLFAISGGMVEVGRSFTSTAIDSQPFNMLAGGISMSNSGQGPSSMEAMSHDYGPAGAALHADIDSSFPIGILEVGPRATVLSLVDSFDNDVRGQASRESVYVDHLIVHAGSRLNTNGVKVYARSTAIDGTVDNMNNIVALGGPCDSDLAIDAVVDDADFTLFVSAYNVAVCSDSAMPRLGGGGCRADLNFDGVVDDADFQVFIGAYDRLVCD